MSNNSERAIARARDYQMANWLTLTVGLAAEQHPDVLREALGKVFDLSAVETNMRNMDQHVAAQWERLQDLRTEIAVLEEKVRRLTMLAEEAHFDLDRAFIGE